MKTTISYEKEMALAKRARRILLCIVIILGSWYCQISLYFGVRRIAPYILTQMDYLLRCRTALL